MAPDEQRAAILAGFGADGAVLDELMAYNRNVFAEAEAPGPDGSFADEPFVADWARYAAQAQQDGAAAALRGALVQLAFPVRAGIGEDPAYRASTRRGEPPDPALAAPWQPRDPQGIAIRLQPSLAGRIPVVSVRDRTDFETLLQCILHRNEPVPIPRAMGATMVAGYNNWERIARHRARWLASGAAGSWDEEFARLVPHKPLYQDRFIVVSHGPYSNVSAQDLGLDDATWLRQSLEIRIHHECGHYLTKRRFGVMRNNLLDEVLADTLGLVGATGAFHAAWFLRFMGLEDFPAGTRPGGRIEVYRGEPPLSPAAFEIVKALLVRAAHGLERRFGPAAAQPPTAQAVLAHLRHATLETLAQD